MRLHLSSQFWRARSQQFGNGQVQIGYGQVHCGNGQVQIGNGQVHCGNGQVQIGNVQVQFGPAKTTISCNGRDP